MREIMRDCTEILVESFFCSLLFSFKSIICLQMLLFSCSTFDWFMIAVLAFMLWIFQTLSDDINEILIHQEIFLSIIDMRHDEDVKILLLKWEDILKCMQMSSKKRYRYTTISMCRCLVILFQKFRVHACTWLNKTCMLSQCALFSQSYSWQKILSMPDRLREVIRSQGQMTGSTEKRNWPGRTSIFCVSILRPVAPSYYVWLHFIFWPFGHTFGLKVRFYLSTVSSRRYFTFIGLMRTGTLPFKVRCTCIKNGMYVYNKWDVFV
jgi:hypothetical protein